jgi:release factor glutamine methyltransferase
MKALDKLHNTSKTLELSAIESPEKEAEIILRSVLDISLVSVYRDNPELTPDQVHSIEQVVVRRINREPLQYILGNVDFMGLKLHVGPGVLIPRPETELMAEYAIKKVGGNGRSPLHILDLCTGSGCLALAFAKQFPDAQVYGTDISEIALEYARQNAGLNNISNVSFVRGNFFEPFKNPPESPFSKGGLIYPPLAKRGEGRFSKSNFFDLIISNPPYIRTDDIKDLQPEIRDWEPLSALDGGADGLDCYRAIIPAAWNFLNENGMLVLELGIDCARSVKEMLKDAGYSGIELRKDLAGIERIAAGKRDSSIKA